MDTKINISNTSNAKKTFKVLVLNVSQRGTLLWSEILHSVVKLYNEVTVQYLAYKKHTIQAW